VPCVIEIFLGCDLSKRFDNRRVVFVGGASLGHNRQFVVASA